jgi:hypothetical protein
MYIYPLCVVTYLWACTNVYYDVEHIHEPEAPIRPVINNTYAPTHKISKYIHGKLCDLLNLKHEYVINTTQFTENIRKLKFNPDHKILTMDIEDLYVNLPINQTLNIINKLLQNNRVDKYTLKEIMSMITNQIISSMTTNTTNQNQA